MTVPGVSVPAEEQIDAVEGLDRDLGELLDDSDEPDAEEASNIQSDAEPGEADEEEADEEAEEADEAEDEADEEADDDVERVRNGMQRRIDKLTAKSKGYEERYEDSRIENEQLKQKAEAAKLSVETGLDTDYVDAPDAEVVKKYDSLRRVRDWCLEHSEQGYTGDGGKDDPSFEPEEVRRKLEQVRDELIVVGPRAEEIRRESRSRMRADMELGRKVREKREQKRKAAKKAIKGEKVLETGGPTAGRPDKASHTKKSDAIDQKIFEKGGRSPEALIDSMGDDFFA